MPGVMEKEESNRAYSSSTVGGKDIHQELELTT